ncbi:MAG: CUB domain-containing protein [Bacteroidota bacterium]
MKTTNCLLLLLSICLTHGLTAQTYTISTQGSVSTCSGTFYDSGGAGGNYANNENYNMTLCSSSSNCLRITFTAMDLGTTNGDKLRIYDGPSTAYAAIENINGNNEPALPYTITSTSGCLTIRFISDNSGVAAGWAATVSCVACPATPSYDNPNGFIYTCSALFYDNNGAAVNYGNDQNRTTKICSSGADCVRATFSSFQTEAGIDVLTIYDGPNTASPILGTYSGNSSPGVVTSTTGCLTFNFQSDASVRRPGWEAAISCVPCGTPPAPSPQNCAGATLVCSDQSFQGNSDGSGSINDLGGSNDGCLAGENQSSWYYFTPLTGGTIQLNISPQNGSDDYDFAIWGPLAGLTCPPAAAPLRCSYAAGGGNTGLQSGAADQTEGAGGNRFVSPLSVNAGEVYVLIVDNFSESTQPFTLDWTLTGGCSLGCTVLPSELLDFSIAYKEQAGILSFTTASERDVDFFTIEISRDGISWQNLGEIKAKGNSTEKTHYHLEDKKPFYGTTYYRLSETDIHGKKEVLETISGEFYDDDYFLYPVPANKVLRLEGKNLSSSNFTLHSSIGEKLDIHYSVMGDKVEFNVDKLKNGVYFLGIEYKGSKTTERVVIRH